MTTRSDRSPPKRPPRALYVRDVDPATYRGFTRLAYVYRLKHAELLTLLVTIATEDALNAAVAALRRSHGHKK